MLSMKLIAGGLGPAARLVVIGWREAWAALILASVSAGGFLAAVDLGDGPEWRGAWLAAALLATLPAQGALYRLALARPGVGRGGLQWGRVEWRLLAIWLLTAIFLIILGLLLFVALLACAYAVASAGAGFVAADPGTWARAVDARGRIVLAVVAAVGLAALIWARVRLSLAPAASVARGRVQVLSAWPLTRGMAWPIAAATGLVGAGPASLLAALFLVAGKSPAIVVAVGLVQGLVVAGLWLPLHTGLMTYFFPRLDRALSRNPPST